MRLKDWDYSAPGAYFITICTRDKRCILSRIEKPDVTPVGEGLAPPVIKLTDAGWLVEKQIRLIPETFPTVSVDNFMIMPNHVHLLLKISALTGAASCSPTTRDSIIRVVQVIKSQSSRLSGEGTLWQRSFYDHIVRNDTDYQQISEYITSNPARWAEDRFYSG